MNKRAVTQVLIVLLLLLLLVWGLGGPPKKVIRRSGPPESGESVKNPPLSSPEQLREKPASAWNSPPEEHKPVINPIFHSGWVNKGAYEVFGEVRNVGEAAGSGITAHVTFKGGEQKLIGRAEALIDRPFLAPGEKSSFKVTFRAEAPEAIDNYVLIIKVSR